MSVQSGSVVSGRQRSPAPASASLSGSVVPQADGNGKLEQQIVLRLPEKLSEEIRELVRGQKLTPDLIWIHPIDSRNFKFMVGEREFPATLVDLPCIIESQKTFDNSAYYKSADICQMLLVRDPSDPHAPDVEFPSGLTPPTTRIRERRFRKPLYTKEEILKAEAQLLSILEGGPQIQYELVEEEVDVDDESAEESGDEWEDEEDEAEEEEDKWRQSSVRSGTSATQYQNYTPSPGRFQRPTSEQVMASSPRRPTSMTPSFTPSFSQVLPSASPSPMPIRPSTPGMDSIAAPHLGLSRTSSVPGSTPQRNPAASPARMSMEPSPARPMRTPTPSQATPSVPALPRMPTAASRARLPPAPPATVSQPQASPLPPQVSSPLSSAAAPAPSPAPAALQAAASTATLDSSEAAVSSVSDESKPVAQPEPAQEPEPELSPEELQRQSEKKVIEQEIVDLKERIVQIHAKMQTANKILKKRYLKNIAEAEEELAKKNEALSAYN